MSTLSTEALEFCACALCVARVACDNFKLMACRPKNRSNSVERGMQEHAS